MSKAPELSGLCWVSFGFLYLPASVGFVCCLVISGYVMTAVTFFTVSVALPRNFNYLVQKYYGRWSTVYMQLQKQRIFSEFNYPKKPKKEPVSMGFRAIFAKKIFTLSQLAQERPECHDEIMEELRRYPKWCDSYTYKPDQDSLASTYFIRVLFFVLLAVLVWGFDCGSFHMVLKLIGSGILGGILGILILVLLMLRYLWQRCSRRR